MVNRQSVFQKNLIPTLCSNFHPMSRKHDALLVIKKSDRYPRLQNERRKGEETRRGYVGSCIPWWDITLSFDQRD